MYGILKNHLILGDLTISEKDKIKDRLTFKNPQYENVKRFSKWGGAYTKVPKYLMYYKEEKSGELIVPVGLLEEVRNKLDDFKNLTIQPKAIDFPQFVLTLREDQEIAAENFLKKNKDFPCGNIILPTGKGKAQPLNSKVLTPEGYKLMGELEIGSEVYDRFGKPCVVEGIYPQGVKPIYEITFKDKSKVRCCGEHLWFHRTYSEYRCKSKYFIGPLNYIMENLPLRDGRNFNICMPINKPVEFEEKKLPLDAYTVGALIGDGYIVGINKNYSICFSNMESDVVERVNKGISELEEGKFIYNKYTQCSYAYTLPKNMQHIKRVDYKLTKILVDLGLNKYSYEKSIPKEYLYASVEQRFELLKGLFDTDGNVSPNGSFTYSTSSKQLAEDILFLIQSLGIRGVIKDRVRKDKIRKGIKNPRIEYVISIQTHQEIFKSEKHKRKNLEAVKNHPNKNISRYTDLMVTNIELVGEEECQCIKVSSPDHSYLTDSCIVTHNTVTGLQVASRLSTPTLVIVHKDDLVRGWLKDIELAFNGKMNAGLIKGKSKVLGKYITVATIQTLNRLSDEQLERLYKYFGLVIVDEAHHISASSFYLVNNFYAKYKMGLTATPERADGLAHLMKLYLGGFCYEYEKDKKSKIEKDILPVQVIEKTLPLYFNPLCKVVRNKFEIEDYFAEEGIDEGDLIRVSDIPYQKRPRISHHLIDDFVVSNVVKEICKDIKKEYELNRSIVVFFSQKEHCRAYFDYLVDTFKIKSADIGLLYGDNKDNEDVLKKAESKRKFITLTTYAKSTEGTNVKQWEVVFLASSVSNEKNVEQAVGRVRRITDSEKLDKVLVYDYRLPKVYTYSTHSKNRNSRYLKLGFEIVREGGKKLFSRGF